MLRSVHEKLVFNRRVNVLTQTLGELVPPGSTILDVGTGDGQIARAIADVQDGTTVEGIDVMLRPVTHVPVTLFDGTTIPSPARASTSSLSWTSCITRSTRASSSAGPRAPRAARS